MATLQLPQSFLKTCLSYDISREHITTEFVKDMWKKINIRMTAKNAGESHLVCCVFFMSLENFFFGHHL